MNVRSQPVVPDVPPAEIPTAEIPDKLYFRIGEVSRIVGVEAYVLRFWESEFPRLSPKKSGSGQRLYRRKDVELLLELKRLLYEKRFTIEGARLYLEQKRKAPALTESKPAPAVRQTNLFGGVSPDVLVGIRRQVEDILALLPAKPRR